MEDIVDMYDISTRLKTVRYELGLSQKQLSEQLGICLHTIINIETGITTTLRAKTYGKIVKFLRAAGQTI